MNKIIDSCFKLAIIICIVIFLAIFYRSTLNQRYQFHKKGSEDHYIIILDTKMGYLYFTDNLYDNDWKKCDPVNEAISE